MGHPVSGCRLPEPFLQIVTQAIQKFGLTANLPVRHDRGQQILAAGLAKDDLVAGTEGSEALLGPLKRSVELVSAHANPRPICPAVLEVLLAAVLYRVFLLSPALPEGIGNDLLQCGSVFHMGGLQEAPLKRGVGGFLQIWSQSSQTGQLLAPVLQACHGLPVEAAGQIHVVQGQEPVVEYRVYLGGRSGRGVIKGPPKTLGGLPANRTGSTENLLPQLGLLASGHGL